MDTGFLQPGETMEDEYDVGINITPEECLGAMDQILCLEVRNIGLNCLVYANHGVLDGMAYGTPVIPNAIHKHVYRQHTKQIPSRAWRVLFRAFGREKG